MAASFLRRRKDSQSSSGARGRPDAAGNALHAPLEDLYVVHSDGLLLRHRLQVWPTSCAQGLIVNCLHLVQSDANIGLSISEQESVCAVIGSAL